MITDHSSLRWLHNLKNPNGRLARWALSLLEYDFEIVHRKGSSHVVPDALSRMFESGPSETVCLVKEPTPTWYVCRFLAVSSFPEKFPTWQIKDANLYHYRPHPFISNLVGDLSDWKLVPSDSERALVLKQAHDEPQAGHLRVQKTYARVAREYYWPGCYRDVMNYVRRSAMSASPVRWSRGRPPA